MSRPIREEEFPKRRTMPYGVGRSLLRDKSLHSYVISNLKMNKSSHLSILLPSYVKDPLCVVLKFHDLDIIHEMNTITPNVSNINLYNIYTDLKLSLKKLDGEYLQLLKADSFTLPEMDPKYCVDYSFYDYHRSNSFEIINSSIRFKIDMSMIIDHINHMKQKIMDGLNMPDVLVKMILEYVPNFAIREHYYMSVIVLYKKKNDCLNDDIEYL